MSTSEPTLTDAALCPNYSNAQKADFAKSSLSRKRTRTEFKQN